MPFLLPFLRYCTLLPLLLALGGSIAWADTVALWLSDNSAPYGEFAEAFRARLARSTWSTATHTLDALDASPLPQVIVAVGGEALSQALKRQPGRPILATLVSRTAFERVLLDHRPAGRVSAIYLEPPPGRQMALLSQLPGMSRVGIVVSPGQAAVAQSLRTAASHYGMTPALEVFEAGNSLAGLLDTLLPRVDALLMVPDARIFNRDSIRLVLMSALRHRKPVLGYSLALVQAGALLAIHTPPGAIGLQAAELILAHGSQLPPPQYPAQFAIASNRTVANALDIALPADATLHQAVDRARSSP